LKTVAKRLYEGMFLVDSAEAAADWDGVEANIKNVLDRAEAEIVSLRKWEERRLAYEIGGKSKGTYILCYFRADGKRIRDIERDVQLSERVMRVLILCAEHMTQEDIEKETPVVLAERQEEETAEAAVEEAEKKQETAQEELQAWDEKLAVVQEAAEGFGELEEPAEVAEGDEERSGASGAVAADTGEPGQPEQAETKDNSESADEPHTEKSVETEE
jgi:small subunit ribosomal protein S6